MANVNPVSVEELRKMLSYDPDTGDLFWKVSQVFKNGRPKQGKAAKPGSKGYLYVMINSINVLAHRICWALHYGEWPCRSIDHENIDQTDNAIKNLRLASYQQNGINKRSYMGDRPKGVTFKYKSWRSQIGINGKCKHLGMFASKDEAAHAYNKAAITEFGEYAVLNPIGQDKE